MLDGVPFDLPLPTDPPWLPTLTIAGLWLLLVWLVAVVGRRLLLRIVQGLVRRSPVSWDDLIVAHRVPHRLSMVLPILTARAGLPVVPGVAAEVEQAVARFLGAVMILVLAATLEACLSAAHALYDRSPTAATRPIKSYVQLAKVFLYVIAGIFIVARLANQSPWFFVSGLGAMMAIVLLIFRDTLLSLVASVQLTNNDLIRVGDWIEMPQFGADGDVVDIALHTVKVQNWDRTITVIPTHKFLDNSFKNWRGMFEGGGRRIKRAIHINMATIRFLTDDEIERFEGFTLLRDYIRGKRVELADTLGLGEDAAAHLVNRRRLTNLGTLRAYIIAYLRNHPAIHAELTFLVRQLDPTPEGLPIEIYVFTSDTRWVEYEGIQADIFDHILAMVPEFGLRVYQRPSSHDVAGLLDDAVHAARA